MSVVRRSREPQQDRSRATRERLLEATLESLAETGWHGTSVVGVAARAGMSRGAAQHHFATRDELVRAAVDRVSDDLADSLRAAAAAQPGEDRVLSVLEVLAGIWTQTAGRAAMQLWMAAAADPSLRDLVLPLERRFNKELHVLAVELLEADLDQPQVTESVRLTLDLTRGIGLGELLRPDPARRKAELAQWAAVLGSLPGFS